MAVKNIVFDMGNVLLAYNPQEYVKKVLHNPNAEKAVLQELFFGPEWVQLDAGTITEEQAVRQVKLRIPQYADEVQTAMDFWHSDLNPVEGMPEIIDELKEKNYRIFLLSNTSLRFFSFYKKVKMFEKFDGFIVSAKEKLMKPNQAIYQCLCNRYSLIPKECLFIDDLQKNVDGAIQAGFAGHCFTDSGELKTFLKEKGVL